MPTGPDSLACRTQRRRKYGGTADKAATCRPAASARRWGNAPFVGRADELALLCACVDTPEGAGCQVVVVEGDAGAGKSTLVQQALAVAGPRTALTASAVADERSVPYAVLDQLGVVGAPGGPDRDPIQVGAEVVERIGALAADVGGLVIVVEDVQWADRRSLQALSFALRRLRDDPVVAVLTSRPPVPERIRRLLSATSSSHILVEPFSAEEVRTLAEAVVGGPVPLQAARRLQEHTGGLPLYVRAVCAELDADRLAALDRPLPVPRSFSLLVAAQLAGCSPDAAALVGSVAVSGGSTPLGRAAAMAGVGDPAAALDEAVAAGLLEHDASLIGWEVRMRHPLIEAAVLEQLPPLARRTLHLRAALDAPPDDALRHRALAAAGPDPDLADACEARARTHLEQRRVGRAADALLRAHHLTPPGPVSDRRLVEAVLLLLVDGDVAGAAAYQHQIAALLPGSGPSLVLGQLAFLGGRQSEAVAHLDEGWQRRDPASPHLTARLAITRAHLAIVQAEARESITWARRAIDAGGGTPAVDVAAGSLIAIAEAMRGRPADGLAAIATIPAAAAGDRPEALLARGIVGLWSGDLLGAEAALAGVSDAGDRWCPLQVRLSALGCRAKAAYRLGRFDASRAHAELAVSLARDADHRWALSFLCSVATLVPAIRGDWEVAGAHAAAAATAAEEAGGLATDRACAAHAAAHIAFSRHDPAGVVAALEPVLGLLRRDGYGEPGVMAWREMYAEALADVGRHTDADRVARAVEQSAAARGHALAAATALRVRGHLHAAAGDHAAAVAVLEAAGHALAGVEAAFEEALVDDALGRALRRAGQRRRAADVLRRALDRYQDLGAEPFAERAAREAAACGLQPRRRTPASGRELTPQELAVVALAKAGATNREIAAELVVSTKTVEYHLANVFAKLGVRSRRELADHVPD